MGAKDESAWGRLMALATWGVAVAVESAVTSFVSFPFLHDLQDEKPADTIKIIIAALNSPIPFFIMGQTYRIRSEKQNSLLPKSLRRRDFNANTKVGLIALLPPLRWSPHRPLPQPNIRHYSSSESSQGIQVETMRNRNLNWPIFLISLLIINSLNFIKAKWVYTFLLKRDSINR